MRQYGLPYMGSKNKIAEWLVQQLPCATHFYDLCCGGCAVTHAAMAMHKYKHYHVNDITDMGLLFRDIVTGRRRVEYEWVSRDEFFARKDTDPLVRIIWSFGNDGRTYLYGREVEPFKKAVHYAVCFGDYSLTDAYGIDCCPLDAMTDIYDRYLAFKRIYAAYCSTPPIRRTDSTRCSTSSATRDLSDAVRGERHTAQRHLTPPLPSERLESLERGYKCTSVIGKRNTSVSRSKKKRMERPPHFQMQNIEGASRGNDLSRWNTWNEPARPTLPSPPPPPHRLNLQHLESGRKAVLCGIPATRSPHQQPTHLTPPPITGGNTGRLHRRADRTRQCGLLRHTI